MPARRSIQLSTRPRVTAALHLWGQRSGSPRAGAGCRGAKAAKISPVGPCSTILPQSITVNRSGKRRQRSVNRARSGCPLGGCRVTVMSGLLSASARGRQGAASVGQTKPCPALPRSQSQSPSSRPRSFLLLLRMAPILPHHPADSMKMVKGILGAVSIGIGPSGSTARGGEHCPGPTRRVSGKSGRVTGFANPCPHPRTPPPPVLMKFLGDVKLSTPGCRSLAGSAGQQRLLRPENPNRHAGHREVASIRALWLEAAIAARQPCRLRTRNGESARPEGTDVDEKKIAKRTQSRRRNPGGSRD